MSDDEHVHPFDPAVWSWNESWYFSWIDLDRGPAGFFRLGLLPNQERALIWSYVFHDGVWYGTEETRLRYDDFDLTDGMAYDRFGLRFGWRPDDQAGDPRGRFGYDGIVRVVTGAGAGGFVPIALDLSATPTTEVFGTGTGNDLGSEQYPASRFEQSMAVTGTVRIGDDTRSVRAAGHRDRSWGPRNWRVTFTLGDLQSEGAQLYFVGAPQLAERGGGYLRDASGVRQLRCIGRRPSSTTTPRARSRRRRCGSRLPTATGSTWSSFPRRRASASTWRTRARSPSTGSTGASWWTRT